MFALVVDLNVKPETRDRFLAAIGEQAAYQAHRAAPHFSRWREAAAVCLRQDGGQTNTTCTLVFPRTELAE